MGKAYSPSQRDHVRTLLESGRDEESIEKETGVSDRTIRRWKAELERTGRIGKPPESRTGRHRVLTPEIEAALFEHVKANEGLSVDDMLWWLYERYSIVVGTRTIRRVFERKGDKVRGKGRKGAQDRGTEEDTYEDDEGQSLPPAPRERQGQQYQSPYAPVMSGDQIQQIPQAPPKRTPAPPKAAPPPPPTANIEDDEEMLQLELQQIELQKREVELKLKMRRLQAAKGSPAAPTGRKVAAAVTTPLSAPPTTPSPLFNPRTAAAAPTPPKRDSRSKKKIQESKLRTAERQERMLRELERRSRRRDHLTAEWVTSKDIWPLRAQGMLANLMHQYGCYAYGPNNEHIFGQMYRVLYELVDLSKGDWTPEIHDDQLRDRMKRKMGQLRTKMLKSGEIISVSAGRNGNVGDGFTTGTGYTAFQRVENFTGQAAGEEDDEGGMEEQDVELGAQQHELEDDHPQHQHSLSQHQDLDQHEQHMHYELPPEHAGMHGQAQHLGGPYGNVGMMHQHGQYPMIPQGHQGGMMPYAMDGGQHGGQDGMVL